MARKTKIWLIVATSLILVGCIIFSGVMTMFKWDFTKLSTVKYETNNHEIVENFNDISIKTDTADIKFVLSDDEKCRVVCYEEKSEKHLIAAKDNTLTINVVNEKKWYEHIGINFGAPKVTIYIPQSEYGKLSIKSSTGNIEIPKEFKFESIDISESTGNVKNYASATGDIKIKTSTGGICVENVSSSVMELCVSTGKIDAFNINCEGDFKIKVSTGKTNITDVKCKNVISSGSTGDILLNNVVATENFSIERSTGDVKFESCDAAELFIETDTGDVKGSLLSDKVFITETDTGRISVPKTTTGGKCEITTDTGDIKIEIGK